MDLKYTRDKYKQLQYDILNDEVKSKAVILSKKCETKRNLYQLKIHI